MYNVKQIFSCTIMSIILLSNLCYASIHTVSTTISYELNESDTIHSEEIEKIIKNDTGKDSGKTAKVKITENADYYAGIGYRLYRDNNSTKALEYFQKALAIDNNNAISHWGLAKILYRDNVSEKLKHYKLFIDYASIIDYREEIVETLDEVEKYGG